jgi:2,4-dienoyl-CoA reductase-like NADH-dependent reductase (Old Yellow Enzyme family)
MNLFSEFQIRGITFRNRVATSPMCQYSAQNGHAGDWHLVHLGTRATGGAGTVFTEAAAVLPEGRISPADLGLWQDSQIEPLVPITRFLRQEGAVPALQLAHSGFKASTATPWMGIAGTLEPAQGGWRPIYSSSAQRFSPESALAEELNLDGIARIKAAFAAAARRALEAGFELVEIHSAHGYLLHEFLSPLVNQRRDDYGGSFENRIRLLLEVAAAVREQWPERLPLWVRISSTDWVEGGWNIDEAVELARRLKPLGVDLIDCSSGGIAPTAVVPVGPGYQTSFAERIRREAAILTGAVGMITSPQQAQHILTTGQADVILLGRQLLREPYWPLRAAYELHQPVVWPRQYERARW